MESEDEKSKRREEGGEGEANTRTKDWNIRGSKTPGLEHPGGEGPGLERPGSRGLGLERPGLRKEGDTVAENNGEEHMNKGRDQMRKDTTKESQEAQGRQREEQAGPPPKKKQGGGGGGARKPPTATKPPANTTRGGQTPHPEGTEDRTPKEAQGDHPAKTGNTKPGTAVQREKGHRNMQTHTQKKKASRPARKKGDGVTGTTRPGTRTPSNRHHKAKKKAQKTQPDNAAKKGGAQPGPGPSTHASNAHQNRKRRGASGARTKLHTSHKQAET